MKKIIISLIIIFMASGCWNYKELNDYAIATGMAIDYVDGKYMVSFLILNGNKLEKKSSDSQYHSVLYSGSGVTIYEAIKNIDLILPKQLYIGHLNSLVISDSVAKIGLYDVVEYLLEDSQLKKDFYVVLAKESRASDILSMTTPITDNSLESISNNIYSSNKTQGNIISKTYNDIIYDLVNIGIDTSISSYIIVGNKEEGANIDNLESVEPKSYIKLDDLGIFKGDKLIGWANKKLSSCINIINNNINELYINIPCNDGYIVVNTNNLKTIRDISKNYIKINTIGDASIKEVTCDIDYNDNKNINELKSKINKEIKDIIYEGYMFARNYESDVFGFGLDYYRNNSTDYKKINFNDLYLSIEPEINVNVKIDNNGNIKKNIERIANEN